MNGAVAKYIIFKNKIYNFLIHSKTKQESNMYELNLTCPGRSLCKAWVTLKDDKRILNRGP